MTIAQFLIDLERLAFSLFVTRADVNERIVRFAAVVDEIDPGLGRPRTSMGLDLTDEDKRAFRAALDGPL